MSMTPSTQSISQLTKRAREREPTLSGATGEVITQLEDKCCGKVTAEERSIPPSGAGKGFTEAKAVEFALEGKD